MKNWLLAVLAVCGGSVFGQGNFEGIYQYTASPVSAFISGTAGWAFQPNANFEISHLGAFQDALNNNGGQLSVGLWDNAGNLILSNQVTSADTAIGQGRYVLVTPTMLVAGQVYRIGVYSQVGITTVNTVGPQTGGSFSPLSLFQYVGAAQGTNGFGAPNLVPDLNAYLYAGPNFVIPEPTVISLGVLGLLGALIGSRVRPQRP